MNPRTIARRAAREVCHDLGLDQTAPVDVQRIAQQFGAKVVHRDVSGDGRLETRDGQLVIVARRSTGSARQRFTIGHELGHIYLMRAELRLNRQDQERFCDAFAAALLLPTPWLQREADEHPQTLEALRSIAGRAEVSLACALIELTREASWNRMLLRWRFDEGAWRLFSTTSVPQHLGYVRTVPRTRVALHLAAREDPRTPGSIWLLVQTELQEFSAELSAQGSAVIALARRAPRLFQREAPESRAVETSGGGPIRGVPQPFGTA